MPHRDLPDDAADRPVRWWARDLKATPAIAVGVAVGAAAAVIGVVFAVAPRNAAPPQPHPVLYVPPPPVGPAADPVALEPGTECAISNPRSSPLFGGFRGQPALVFDYVFPGGPPRSPGPLLVAVITAPGAAPATTTFLSSLIDASGTVSVAPLGLGDAFPRGTTVYLADQTRFGPDDLPKRVSNILTLE